MNADMINMNMLQKKITSESDAIEYDSATGEITRQIRTNTGFLEREPDYIKIYTDCMLVFNRIDVALSPYLIAFCRYMTYANFDNPNYRCTVRTDELVRRDVAASCNVQDRMVHKAIKALVEAEVFIPVVIDGKKKRGIYFVNPWVVGRGEWKDIRALRAEFEFVSGKSGVLSIDKSGSRKVVMPLTSRKNKNCELDGQVELDFIQEG